MYHTKGIDVLGVDKGKKKKTTYILHDGWLDPGDHDIFGYLVFCKEKRRHHDEQCFNARNKFTDRFIFITVI